jgi:hypothetical protein
VLNENTGVSGAWPLAAGRRGIGAHLRRALGAGLAGLSLCLFAASAQAQSLFDRSVNVTVADRQRPDYDPLGLRLGVGFLLYPKVTVAETYDDNITDLPSNDLLDVLAEQLPATQPFTQYTRVLRPLADAQTSIEPNVTIKSNWNQHSLQFSADAIFNRSADYPSFSATYPNPVRTNFQDSDQYKFAVDGTLNVYHDLVVNFDGSYAHQLLPRTFDGYLIVVTTPTVLGVDVSIAPLYADEYKAKLEVIKDFARLRVTTHGQFQDFEYPPGFGPNFVFTGISPALQPDPTRSSVVVGPFSQAYHNHQSFEEYVRGDYALSSDVALFIDETIGETNYPNIRFRNRFDQETIAGINFQIPSLVTAELGVGYLYSNVYGGNIPSVSTPSFRVILTYFPTSLIDVTLSAYDYIVDSGVPTSPNYLDRNVGLQANYELLRNVIITAHGSLNFEDYRAIDRHVVINEEGLGATYLLNRGMRLTLNYLHRNFSSTGTQPVARRFNEFDDNQVSLGFVLQH